MPTRSLPLDLLERSARDAAIDALHAATAIYTREPVVDQLLHRIGWPDSERTLIDSSCGDGAFLARALEQLLDAQPDVCAAGVLARLGGWEIHRGAAEQARHRLRQVLLDQGRDPHEATTVGEQLVRCADFLTESPDSAFRADCIVGNPPYLRFLNVPDPLRGEYRAILPAHAQADLLHAFIDRCASMLSARGQLALVTSDRWLFASGTAGLREVIGRRFRLAHVERLDAASSFYRPKQRKAGSPPRVHPVAVVLTAAGSGAIPFGRDPVFPGEAQTSRPDDGVLTLGDVARVRLAPWLGTPGVFLVAGEAAAVLPDGSTVPAFDTDDIQGGVLRPPRRRAVVTRPGEAPPAAVQVHLRRELPRMCARGRRRAAQWLPPEPFHHFDLSAPSLLVPRIAKSIRPVRVPPGVLPVNHNLSLAAAEGVSLARIEEVLCSTAAQAWVRARAAPLENGYVAITARLLRQLPVPQADVQGFGCWPAQGEASMP